ncbi:MAG: hypothetical protein MHMPM18_002803 [Marteilia pararefringens]
MWSCTMKAFFGKSFILNLLIFFPQKMFGKLVDIEHLFESKESDDFRKACAQILPETSIILNTKDPRLLKIKFDHLNLKVIVKDCGLDLTKSLLRKSYFLFDDGSRLHIINRSEGTNNSRELEVVKGIADMYKDYTKITSKRELSSVQVHADHREPQTLKYHFHSWS